jgi:hypothetical protein
MSGEFARLWGDATKAAAVELPEPAVRRMRRLEQRDGRLRHGVSV